MDTQTARRRIAGSAHLNAFISLSDEEGPGPVIAVKDLIDVRGMVTTGGGIQLPATRANEDAACVRLARGIGASVIGKANLHKFAHGPTSQNPHYGSVLNPRDTTRIAGGSSGGSAAAVAAGLCDWAIGTDTSGSIRMPAALCGVVGYKPTIGNIPTVGVLQVAQSLDTVGSLAPDVMTAVRAVEVMASRGRIRPAQAPAIGRLKIGVPGGWVEDLDEDVAAAWATVSSGFAEIPFPARSPMTHTNMPISQYEAAEFHHRWLERSPEKYGPDVLQRLQAAARIPHDNYVKALWTREMSRIAVREAMRGLDAMILPASSIVAPRQDEGDRREALTRFLRPFSLTGQPVVTLPAPVVGLPVGIQVVGRFGDDATTALVALVLEREWASVATSPVASQDAG